MAAESLFGVVLKEIQLENQHMRGAYLRGYRSNNATVNKISDEIGCVRILNAGADDDIRISLTPGARVFRHHNRFANAKTNPFTGDVISTVTKNFSDHLDSCLEFVKKKLSPEGRDRLLAYVAEVLINAHEHSGQYEWTIVGYIDGDDKNLVYRCAIFSLGKTMANTFEELDQNSYAWKLVAPYVSLHQKGKFFGPNWTEKDLITVVALQGHISSKSVLGNDRGQGTVDLIEFFQSMAEERISGSAPAIMTVYSGSTHIRFDGKYKMKFEKSANRSVIAFNKANNLAERPDQSVVRSLRDAYFPGTLISVAVPLADGAVEDI